MVVTLCPCCRETKSGFLPIMRFQLTEVCRAQMGRPSVGVSRHKPPTLCPCGISRLSKSGDGRYSFQRGDNWGHHLPRKRRRQASEKLRASSAISRSAVTRAPHCAASLAKGSAYRSSSACAKCSMRLSRCSWSRRWERAFVFSSHATTAIEAAQQKMRDSKPIQVIAHGDCA